MTKGAGRNSGPAFEVVSRHTSKRESYAMTPEQFKSWRKHMGWSQQEAADHLGVSKGSIQLYERGEREGRPVEIPKTVELACAALALGIRDYAGPQAASPAAEPA